MNEGQVHQHGNIRFGYVRLCYNAIPLKASVSSQMSGHWRHGRGNLGARKTRKSSTLWLTSDSTPNTQPKLPVSTFIRTRPTFELQWIGISTACVNRWYVMKPTQEGNGSQVY